MVQPSFYFYSFMKLRVLYAVLDWGLGHATRSETLIRSLNSRGLAVSIASSGLALKYLKLQFPNLSFLELPDREVKYSKSGATLGILRRAVVQRELNNKQQKWTQFQLEKAHFDFVISDNVYGVYSPDIPSVLITHQLKPLSPVFQKNVSKKIASWVNRFDEVWIPDFGEDGIAGEMLNNPIVNIPRKYLGNISRFENFEVKKEIDFLGIISGPEPQAELFYNLIQEKLRNGPNKIAYNGKKSEYKGKAEHVELDNNQNLNTLAAQSHFIICRSGFTSLLDILKIRGNALIIPTPGQPEQEYLAHRMKKMNLMHNMSQKQFKRSSLGEFNAFHMDSSWSVSKLNQVLDKFLESSLLSAE